MKYKLIAGIYIVLAGSIISSTAFAQTDANAARDAAIKAVKKELEKNSRYLVQDIVIDFKPMDFKSCKVSYTFQRINSLGSDNFGSATVDRNSATGSAVAASSTSSQTVSSVTGNSAGLRSDNNPTFNNRDASSFNTQRITYLDLGEINAASVAYKAFPDGVRLGFAMIGGRPLIEKRAAGGGAAASTTFSVEFLPIVSEKKAESVKAALLEAIRQCQTPK